MRAITGAGASRSDGQELGEKSGAQGQPASQRPWGVVGVCAPFSGLSPPRGVARRAERMVQRLVTTEVGEKARRWPWRARCGEKAGAVRVRTRGRTSPVTRPGL
jgi:hypothetical protein